MVTAGLELPPGTSVDRRYRVQRILGRGGFGRTYLAADEWRFGELCVLKEFVPSSQGDSIVAQKLHELFQREATVLHKLNHQQIPKFFAVFEEDGRLFIAQEYIDGKTCWTVLQERQRQGRAFTEAEVMRWLQDLLQVLNYLHGKNIVHRDISPDNIMLPKGRKFPVLIDFGVVKQAATHFYGINAADPDGLIQASVSVGKFGYAPYEQIRMGQCSPRSDLYALGVTAVVLLTGKTPNLLIDPQSLEWQWRSQVRINKQLGKILDRMMAEKPQDRYPSAKEVLKDLHLLYGSTRWSRNKGEPRPAAVLQPQSGSDRLLVHETLAGCQSVRMEMDSLQSIQDGDVELAVSTQVETTNFSTIRPIAVQPTTVQPTTIKPAATQTTTQATTRPFPLLALTGEQAYSESTGSESKGLNRLGSSRSKSSQLESSQRRSGGSAINSATRIEPIPPSRSTFPANQPLTGQPLVLVGKEAESVRLSLKRILILSFLAILPIGGALLGVQSPYINSLCQTLDNCAGDQQSVARYHQAVEQATSAKTLSENAQNLSDLQSARDRLSDSIAQLNALAGNPTVYPEAQQVLSSYQEMLQQVETRLEVETRSTHLLQRAEAEAQKAGEQTRVAQTNGTYEAASLQWRKVLATLQAIPNDSFVVGQKVARSQEYKARLDTVNLRVAAATKSQDKSVTPNGSAVFSQPTHQPTIQASQRSTLSTSQAGSKSSPQSRPQVDTPGNSSQVENRSVASQPANPSKRSFSSLPPASTSYRNSQTLTARTNPLQNTASDLRNRIFTGNVALSAIQTLDDVSVWIDGGRINPSGNFVANLVIENHSDRPFGFVPLFAEVRDANNQPIRSRLMFNGSDAVIAPGGVLKGQVYVLGRQWKNTSPQNLALVIREGTSGSRRFHVSF